MWSYHQSITNSKGGKDLKEVIEEIANIVDGPISAEVISLDVDGMLNEARELAKFILNSRKNPNDQGRPKGGKAFI